jgi:aromatic-L-amino-acid/L-tryptophan decarboxylase
MLGRIGTDVEGAAVNHPLGMDAEAMRRAGYATVDALVARMTEPGADPVVRRAEPAEMQARLAGGPPEGPTAYAAVLERVMRDVLPFTSRTDHPGYFAFVPSFTSWPAALAELTYGPSSRISAMRWRLGRPANGPGAGRT